MYRIGISSDREKLVAEIFFGDTQWAEVNQEREIVEVEFYIRLDGPAVANSLRRCPQCTQ